MSEYAKGICTECASEQPAGYMEKSAFQKPPCKYCGGVVHIIDYDADSRAYVDRQNAARGINTSHSKADDED